METGKLRALKFCFVISFVLLASIFVSSGCGESAVGQQPVSYRFERVRRVSFEKPHGHERCECAEYATVYRDRETGIEYLYYNPGLGHTGPAITRLWEAEDEE